MNIKKYWVEFEELMRSTRYLWSPLPTEFDLEEWKGEKLPDGQRGFGIAGKFYDLLNRGMNAPYRDWETDRKSTRLNSSHEIPSRMPSSA